MYLVVWRPRHTTDSCYELSESRDAIKHMKTKNAETVWVYDRDGWWLSFADRDCDGKPYRPRMYKDGEPKTYYALLYRKLSGLSTRFEPLQRFALDGLLWWCIYDLKLHQWSNYLCFGKYETRKAALRAIQYYEKEWDL